MELNRGDLVIVSAPGSYGKPRPSVIIQSGIFHSTGSLTVLLMTSKQRPDLPLLRHTMVPTEGNGLTSSTDVMIEKSFTIPRNRLGKRIGRLTASQVTEITAAVAVFLGI